MSSLINVKKAEDRSCIMSKEKPRRAFVNVGRQMINRVQALLYRLLT